MTGNDGLLYALFFIAAPGFALCGALSVVALLFQGRVARIAQRIATTGVILIHAIILLAGREEWVGIAFRRNIPPFFWMSLIGHALVLAGFLRVRFSKHTTDSWR
jgi:hypothetical protein